LAANPVVAAYLRRRLLDAATTESADWFAVAVEDRKQRLSVDGSDDVSAAMAVLIDVAPVLLGPLLAHSLDCDATELAQRWRRVETTLLGLPTGESG
jgi:hypothetical protein